MKVASVDDRDVHRRTSQRLGRVETGKTTAKNHHVRFPAHKPNSLANALIARARWDRSFFSPGPISARVRPSDLEDRVVPEPSVATSFCRDHTLETPLSQHLDPVGENQGHHGPETGGSIVHTLQRGQHVAYVVVIGCIGSGEPRRVHSGCTVQRINLEPGVVGNHREPDRLHDRPRFQQSVLFQR